VGKSRGKVWTPRIGKEVTHRGERVKVKEESDPGKKKHKEDRNLEGRRGGTEGNRKGVHVSPENKNQVQGKE